MSHNARRILFTGHFGSGKTELAVNYSIRLAHIGQKTTLVDLDIVNPFFRSSEIRDQLTDLGIKVLSPTFAGTASDVPSLPAEIYSVFSDPEAMVIFDVGGDETGARALGRYYPYFMKASYRMFYVINTRRPLSAEKRDILDMLSLVEEKSRLKVTDLINNTNLSYETNVEDILEGQRVVDEVSTATGVPVAFVAGMPSLEDALPEHLRRLFFPVTRYMRPSWG